MNNSLAQASGSGLVVTALAATVLVVALGLAIVMVAAVVKPTKQRRKAAQAIFSGLTKLIRAWRRR